MAATVVRLPFKAAIPLSVIMILFSLVLFVKMPVPKSTPPLFAIFREPDSGLHFIKSRRNSGKMWIYIGLHAVPAIVWSILIPLQHIEAIRRRWILLHRLSGYVVLTASFILGVVGLYFTLADMSYTHKDIWHVHGITWKGYYVLPFVWPTFSVGGWVFAVPYFVTLVQTFRTVRAGDIAAHRRWAVMHSIWAYAIAINRVYVTLIVVGARLLPLLPRKAQDDWLQLPHDQAGMAAVETSTFAAAAWYAYATSGVWAAYELKRAGYFKSQFANSKSS